MNVCCERYMKYVRTMFGQKTNLLNVAVDSMLTGFQKVRSEYQHNTSLHLESRC